MVANTTRRFLWARGHWTQLHATVAEYLAADHPVGLRMIHDDTSSTAPLFAKALAGMTNVHGPSQWHHHSPPSGL